MRAFLSIVVGSTLIFFFSWFIVSSTGINNLDIQSEDTLPAMFLPYSILQNGDIYLDPFYNQLLTKYPQPDDKDYSKGNVPFYLKKVNGHYLSAFTIITPILVLPIYFIPVLMGLQPVWANLIILSHISSAVIIGFSGWILYLILSRRLQLSKQHVRIITLVYLFGTINYALISQALWQHGAVQLLLLLGLYFYLGNNISSYFFAGIFWGFAFLARPTALLPIVIFTGALILSHENLSIKLKNALSVSLGFVPAVLFFIWYNTRFYQSFTNQGYSDQLFTSWLGDFPISFFGVWLSPSKGILVYSPVLIFGVIGWLLLIKSKKVKTDDIAFLSGIIVLLHTLVISFWKHWYGGWSFGYRMSSDVIPFMTLMLIPFLQSDFFNKYKKMLYLFLVISVLIQILAFIFYDGIWHAAYDRGFHDTSWLWSLSDSEFAFNIRRVLVKLDLLEQACPKCLPQ